MSSNVNDILQGVLNPPPAVDLKKQSVVEATQSKANNLLDQYVQTSVDGYNLAASALSGRGQDSQSRLEFDLQNLSRYDLENKYGAGIAPYIQESQDGQRAFNQDRSTRRSGTEGITDLGLGVAAGAAATGHIASLGAGLVNDKAGEITSQWVNNLIEGIQGYQSPTTQASRTQNEALYGLSERDHQATPMGTLERIGRDAVSAITASVESGNISDLLAQAGGSLLSGAAVGGLATKVATGLVPTISQSAQLASRVRAGAMIGTIGGMEGGGAYADVISRINEMSHQELMQHPYYRKIYDMTGDMEQALNATKYAAAKRAGIQMGIVGGLTGSLVSKFEANPLASRSVNNAFRNFLGETIEEGTQGVASPAISNLAIRDYADESQSISEGIGRGLGEGTLAGAGISGIVQAPGVAAQLAYDGTKRAGRALTRRIDAVEQEIKNSSPVSTAQLAPVATELNTNIAQAQETLNAAVSTLPLEQQEQANEFVERLVNLGSFTDGQYQNPILDTITQGSASKLEALQKIGEVIADPNVDENIRILGALEILLTQTNTMAMASSDIQAYEQLSDDSLAAKTVNDIVGITQQILNNPEVKDAVEVAQQILEQNAPEIAPVTHESINTPEGQQNIDTAVKVAQVAPEKGNLEVNQQILYHATNGDISLTPAQMQALEISNALIQAERNSQALGSTLNLSEDASRVNREITLEGDNQGLSIAEHARGIYHALLNNDQEAATQRVIEMGNFAKHMLNKADALTQHINAGKGTPRVGYEAWNQTARAWFDVEGKEGMFYVPGNKVSEDLAKSIFHEASLAADVYNNMVDATGYGTKVTVPTIPPVVMGEAAVAPVDQEVPVLTPEQASQLSDEALANRVQEVRDTPVAERTQAQRDTAKVLREEAKSRKDALESAAKSTRESLRTGAKDTRTTSPEPTVVDDTPNTPSVTTTQAKKLSDPDLNDQLNNLLDIPESDRSPVESATLDILVAEMNAREHQAGIDLARQEEAENQESVEEPAQDTTPVVGSETVVETPQTETETPAVELKGTAAVYSQLLGVVEGRNVFVNSFQFPKTQRIRFPNEETPILNIQDVMENSLTVGEHLGSKWASRYDDRVAGAWFDFLNNVGKKLSKRVQARFDHYINQEKETTDRKTGKKKKNPSLLQRFLKGDKANVYENGLLLNIAEPITTKSGRETAVLNRELLENATIAAMDWLLNMRSGGRFNSVDDTVDVAKGLLGKDVETVSWDIVNLFNNGLSSSEVLTDLGTKIQKYWGLQDTNDGFVGDQRGIVESLARELLIELVNMGLITETKQRVIKDGTSVRFLQSHDDINDSITVIRFELNTEANFGLNETQAMNLQATKSLLEELMVEDPELTHYIGKDAIPKTSQTQLRNPLVPTTRQQRKVEARANRTIYTADTTMASLYGLFGKHQLANVFGGQDTTKEDSFNINHLKSVEGQNKNIAAAYEQLESLLAEMSSIAEAEGIPVDEVAVRFKHEFASVNRLFLQGPYNPQTSKLMRDVLLPTWRNMNLTDADQLDYFFLALAQGLDISIHRQSHETSIEQVTNFLSNGLKDAVEMVRGFMKQADPNLLLNQENASADLQKLKDIFTAADLPFNTLALKSLVEYVKFQDSTDLSNFNTSIYIEADGMTNGPANAMMLFYSGVITPEWIENMERVGLYFNQLDATANSKNTSVQDTYQASANKFVEKINEYIKNRTDWQKEKAKSIHNLVSMFNSDFNFNEEENSLTVKRGFMKNPLMVMIYGSSANGVANSMASALVDSIYERMSQAIQRMDADPTLDGAQAMFPEGNSEQQWNDFVAFLSNATGSNIKINSFQEFTITPKQFTELSKSIKFNLVDSMYAAIKETVGEEVFRNVEMMRNAISAMSIYGASLQKQLINKQLEMYKEGEEPYSTRQLLKRKDLREIERKIREVSAYIETANQNFHITGSSDISIARSTSTGLDGSHHMEGSLRGYGNAGVSGVAYMNQGSGDAQMVQNGYEKGGPEMERVLPAFDGMHFAAADAEAGGRTMNQAVWDSWMANPMKGVADSFRRFMREADLSSMDDDSRKDFLKAVGDIHSTGDAYADTLANAERMQQSLDNTAAEIQKNHEAVSKVPSATDQMAGPGATHINEGTVPLGSTDPVAIAEELNALREDTSEDVPPATIRELVAPKGRPATWVQTIFANALPKFLEGNFLNQDQKDVLQDVLIGKYLKDWEIFIGSPRSLKDLVRKRGIGTAQLQEALNSGKGGFTIPGTKQIFIMNDSAETVLHEVLHAATFQKVLDHVEGRTNNVAVERIQGMMDEFMKLTLDDYGHLASTAMQASALQRVISEARSQGNEAVAINEFMAWTLSNVSLTELAKKQTLPKVLQIAKDAWAMLKELIFGKKFAPRVGTDMYSNLRFNTALIIQSNLGVSELVASGPTLYHDTSKADPDLVKLDETLQRVIIDQLQVREGFPREHLSTEMLAKEVTIAIQASEAATAAYFNMTNEEAEVFRSVVTALTVEQNLDRDTTREANRLYTHVVRNLKVEDFMEDGADPAERAYANAKYSLVTGASFSEIDGAGRSTALPVFFALAMTSREFKDVLSKMEMPKGMKSEETGVDGALENFGYKAMDSLGSKLSGTGHATNIQQAMNILGNKLIEQQEARENRLEVPGRWIDKVNDTVVEYANHFANSMTPELTDAEKAQRTTWDKGLDGLKNTLAIAISEDVGARVAEDVTAAADRRAVQHWARELLAELMGRTPSNALIYDMIKQVRSTIQAIRQNYRINLPKHIRKQFSRDLSEQEWSSLQKGIINTDLASLALQGYSKQDIDLWASNDTARRTKIKSLEDTLNMSKSGSVWIEKAQQLANYMTTREKGINLLKNAEAITDVLGTGITQDIAKGQTREEVVKTVDALVSLYAVDGLNVVDKSNLASIVKSEEAGINYVMSYLTEMVRDERSRITPESKYNAYKGFIPFEQKPNTSLIVGHESQHADLITRGYTMVRDFEGANAHMNRGLAYYRMDASAKAAFNQGIVQTAKATTFGVDPSTGYSNSHVVKRITDPVVMKRMLRRQNLNNPLVPVYDASGKMIALEQGMEASVLESVRDEANLAETIGKWKGRQQEEVLSQEVNKALVDRLKDQFDADPDRSRYEDVFASEDPVIKDAVANIPRETREYIHSVFGKEFLVQRNMLRDVLGYRDASIRDSWTGVTRMPKSTQKAIRDMATVIMGKDAYKNMVRAEEIIENLASNAKVLIAIKSGIVPAINIVSNLVHLVSRGVPINQMRKNIPRKLAEIKEYSESKIQLMKLEADYAAATQANERASLMAQMQAIEDGHRRLSIWPLIEAGEFTAISDVDLRDTDTRITSGKWAEYFDEAAAKLPDGLNTAGRYLLVSKDTALFNGMQKAVEYGDLVAKAILYDDLVSRGQKTKEEALGIITEEFVNYDRLPGRARGKLEKLGLLWFYNFKLRSVKVAVSTMRNNPVHTLLALAIPTDFGIGDAGIPVEDNAVTMALEGRLGYSIGPGQGIRAPSLNPWLSIIE